MIKIMNLIHSKIKKYKKINVLIVGTAEMSKTITYARDLPDLLDVEDKEFNNY
jgi:hypothetical protein